MKYGAEPASGRRRHFKGFLSWLREEAGAVSGREVRDFSVNNLMMHCATCSPLNETDTGKHTDPLPPPLQKGKYWNNLWERVCVSGKMKEEWVGHRPVSKRKENQKGYSKSVVARKIYKRGQNLRHIYNINSIFHVPSFEFYAANAKMDNKRIWVFLSLTWLFWFSYICLCL